MRIAIHQPHYFPWLGYLEKLKNVDAFVLLDQVQLEKGSYMTRNRVVDQDGEIRYLTISCDTTDFLTKEYRELPVKGGEWISKQINCIQNYYRKAKHKAEIDTEILSFFSGQHQTVFEWTYESIKLAARMLDIQTPILLQSDLNYDRTMKRSDLVLGICEAVGADEYYSGRGASVQYLNREQFEKQGIRIVFQQFQHPVYKQTHTKDFVPGLSVLDAFYNCGSSQVKSFFLKEQKQL